MTNGILKRLVEQQNCKCYYCECEMMYHNRLHGPHPENTATVEHLRDKWDTRGHKDWGEHNLVAACFKCNNERGNHRNRVARRYYQQQMDKKRIKGSAASIKSALLIKTYGPVPRQLFGVSI